MREKQDFKLRQKQLADALNTRIDRVTALKSETSSREDLYRETEAEIVRRTDYAYDDGEQDFLAAGGSMVAQDSAGLRLRKKLYRIPVFGQLLRIARHAYFLPRLVENDMPRLVRQMQETTAKVDQIADQFSQGMVELDALIDGASGLHRKADRALEARDAMFDLKEKLDRRLDQLDNRVEDVVAANGLINRKLTRLPEVTAVLATSAPQQQKAANDEAVVGQLHDLYQDFYTRLENRYRGSREDIMVRQSVYLPDLTAARDWTGDAHVLDIGCGRGEFLELLGQHAFSARGVDLNEVQVGVARDSGLDAIHGDGLRLLSECEAESLTAVTAMHVIEHIPFEQLINLCSDALEALKPGGVAIFETPDPENLVVGANTFYFDPTHVRPLPSELVAFVMEYAGFSDVEVRRLHPKAEYEAFMKDPAKDDYLTELVFGPQDYAVIGRKRAVS